MKSTKLERSRMMGKLSSPVLKSSEEGQPSHLDNRLSLLKRKS
ncbi:hypothetical protein [Wolbachia endosymbiont of Armadillidium arcangelii]|uniref:Uncharacterized protein n=1 Tax=Wolbachia endosymbiont of Armadillidium arcangelii TaxID=3158571 RepID=A0AAU7Q125_9RICK